MVGVTEITRRPPTTAALVSVAAGAVGLFGVGVVDGTALAVGAAGLPILALGAVRGDGRAVTAGAGIQGVAAAWAGLAGAGPEPLLASLAGTVVAWDVGHLGVGLGEQLGREARSRRLVAVHAAASVAVGAVTAGLGYAVFLSAGGGQPVAAVVFLLAGALAIAHALRR